MLILACLFLAALSVVNGNSGHFDCDAYESVERCPDQQASQMFKTVNGQTRFACKELNGGDEDSLDKACRDPRISGLCLCTCHYKLYCSEIAFPPPSFQGCFSGDSLVETEEGLVAVKELEHLNDPLVKVVDSSNQITYSPVRLWLHSLPGPAEHFQLETGSGHTLYATSEHLVYEVPCSGGGGRSARYMADLRPGQCVLVEQGGSMVPTPVTGIRKTQKSGRYAFTTETGTVVVNGVAASNYGHTGNERAAHWFFSVYYYMKSILPIDAQDAPKAHPITFGAFDWEKML